jgi:hypothetical protein
MKAQVIQKGSRTLIQIEQRPIIHRLEKTIKNRCEMILYLMKYAEKGSVWCINPNNGELLHVANALKDLTQELRVLETQLITEKCVN